MQPHVQVYIDPPCLLLQESREGYYVTVNVQSHQNQGIPQKIYIDWVQGLKLLDNHF